MQRTCLSPWASASAAAGPVAASAVAAVNDTAKPDSSCAGWKGREVLQCLPQAKDSMQVDQTELGWILLHQELPCSALVLKHEGFLLDDSEGSSLS